MGSSSQHHIVSNRNNRALTRGGGQVFRDRKAALDQEVRSRDLGRRGTEPIDFEVRAQRRRWEKTLVLLVVLALVGLLGLIAYWRP